MAANSNWTSIETRYCRLLQRWDLEFDSSLQVSATLAKQLLQIPGRNQCLHIVRAVITHNGGFWCRGRFHRDLSFTFSKHCF